MSPLINPVSSGFSDPLILHREALRSCQARFQTGEYNQALTGLQSLFCVVSQELNWRGLTLRGQLSRSAAEGLLSDSQLPLAAALLPAARERTLAVATAPYAELLAEAYHLAGGIFSKLDTPRAAARAYAEEIAVRQRLNVRTDTHAQAIVEAFFLQFDALVEALDLRAADQHLMLAKSISRGFSASHDGALAPPWSIADEVVKDPLVLSFLMRAEEYRQHLGELRGVILRTEAIEGSFAGRALIQPHELREDIAELHQHARAQREQGQILPRKILERLALLHASAAYMELRAFGGSSWSDESLSSKEAAALIASLLPEVRSHEVEQSLRVLHNAAQSRSPQFSDCDLRPYHSRCILSDPLHYLPEVLLLASFDSAQAMLRTGRFKEAHTVHEWIKDLLSSIDARISPDAVVIHLNDADAAFSGRELSAASRQAEAALSLSRQLPAPKSAPNGGAAEFQSQALVRLGLYAQHRFCRVPEVVSMLESAPSNERRQLWAIDLLPRLRELQMEEVWGELTGLWRQATGCDQMLSTSGKKVSGVRVVSSPEELDRQLSRYFLYKAARHYGAAAKQTRNPELGAQLHVARAMLRARYREPTELALSPVTLLR